MVKNASSDEKVPVLPLWLRVTVSGIVCSHWYLFLETLPYAELMGRFPNPKALIFIALFCLIWVDFVIVGLVWLTPKNKYLLTGYEFLRYSRWIVLLLGGLLFLALILSGKYPTNPRRIIVYTNVVLPMLLAIGLRVNIAKKKHSADYSRWVLIILVALVPTILSWGIVSFGYHQQLSDFHPTLWNDQIGYWLWTRSFSDYGFGGGYNGWDEINAPAEFNPFGEGGPYYPVIYGTVGKIVGWSPALPLFINMGLISIALFVYLHATKPSRKGILLTGLMAITLWPILLYLLVSMHEAMNQAIAITLAGFIYLLLKRNEQTNLYFRIAIIIYIVFASFIRFSWVFLLLPVLLITIKGNPAFRMVISIILSTIIGIAVLKINGYLVPPVGNYVYELLNGALSEGPLILLRHAKEQIALLITQELGLIVVFQMLTVLGFCISDLYRIIKQKKLSFIEIIQTQAGFNVYNLSVIMLAGIFFYLVRGYHRVFFAPLLLTSFLLMAYKKYTPVYAIIILSIVTSMPYFNLFQMAGKNFQPRSKEFLRDQAFIEEFVVFDEKTNNRWCNTVLISVHRYNYYSTLLPSGIGVSPIVRSNNLEFPLKSNYLMFDTETFDSFSAMINTKPLLSLDYVTLYHNLDSGCPQP